MTDARPLAGRTVVVTRPRAQAAELAAALEGLGAEVVAFPTIRVIGPDDPGPLRRAAAEAAGFDWIVFTSANAVERFRAALQEAGKDFGSLAPARLCAVGPATAEALERHGARAEVVPAEHTAAAAAAALAAADEVAGKRVLFPRADIARRALSDELRRRGAEVVEVVAYRTVPDGRGVEEVRRRLATGEVDVVTFTSGSTVRNYVQLLGPDTGGARVVSIGPATTAAARELGLLVHVEAEEHTTAGLVEAVRRWYQARAG